MLKPTDDKSRCPFCFGVEFKVQRTSKHAVGYDSVRMVCTNEECAAEGPIVYFGEDVLAENPNKFNFMRNESEALLRAKGLWINRGEAYLRNKELRDAAKENQQ